MPTLKDKLKRNRPMRRKRREPLDNLGNAMKISEVVFKEQFEAYKVEIQPQLEEWVTATFDELFDKLIGPQGIEGTQGIQGVQGEKGDTGIQGDRGTDGLDGKEGVDGTDGVMGDEGKQGKTGGDGKTPTKKEVKQRLIELLEPEMARIKKEIRDAFSKDKKGGGGGGQGAVQHESFAISAGTTSVTLAFNVAGGGTAIYTASYEGQNIELTNHYTIISGNVVSFNADVQAQFINDTIFAITYSRT